MKKLLIFIITIIILVIIICLLIIFKKRNYQLINYEYLNAYYIEEQIDKELLITNYNDYINLIDKYNLDKSLKEEDFNNFDYLVIFDSNMCDKEKEIGSIKYYLDNTLEITYNIHKKCGLCAPHTDIYLYKIDKLNINKITKKYKKLKDEVCDPDVAYKPILYLYPNKDMYISIKLENDNNIITSYPKYNNGWNVLVDKNGLIHYNNRDYYALYWDEYNNNQVDFREGFYVTKDESLKFLEEKLDLIGLNNREANEFIMYWLPILESNEQSLVYFELTDERELNNKLIINPKPDSMLRINMHIKKVYNKIDIKNQELKTFKRYGFTAIEWGGTIHKEG